MISLDLEKFRKRYPYLNDVPDEVIEDNWLIAQFWIGQKIQGVKVPDEIYEIMLYLMTCHLTVLGWIRGDGSVGILQSATQGKVSVSFKTYDSVNWYNQTPCGATLDQLFKRWYLGGHLIRGDNC